MEEKMFRKGGFRTTIRCLLLLAIVAASIFGTVYFGNIFINGKDVFTAKNYGEYVYIDAYFSSKPFASDDIDNQFTFVTTFKGEYVADYMLMLSKAEMERDDIKKLIENAYADNKNGERPKPIRLKGVLKKSSKELENIAQQYYGTYIGKEVKNAADELSHAVIKLDENFVNRISWPVVGIGIFVLVIIISGIAEFFRVLRRYSKKSVKIDLARNLYYSDENYKKGVEEINLPETVHYKNCKCYITPNYVVTYKDGLEVFSIDSINELHGYDHSDSNLLVGLLINRSAGAGVIHSLAALTSDNEAHIFAGLGIANKVHDEIVTKLLNKNKNILLGRNNISFDVLEDNENIKLAKINGFYGSNAVWKGRANDTFIIY